jgi:catechol 2,3-dioxygenase-like lactoylglutathione lyase family enzyme
VKPHVSVVTLGVRDVERAKRFYGDGLGWPIHQDQGEWSRSASATGSLLGLYPWDALGEDAGVGAEGGEFGGITLSYVVRPVAVGCRQRASIPQFDISSSDGVGGQNLLEGGTRSSASP